MITLLLGLQLLMSAPDVAAAVPMPAIVWQAAGTEYPEDLEDGEDSVASFAIWVSRGRPDGSGCCCDRGEVRP